MHDFTSPCLVHKESAGLDNLANLINLEIEPHNEKIIPAVPRLGVRFYLHGDVVPDGKIPLRLPNLDETHAPLFETRGIQPFHDFPEGPDWWNRDDWLAYVSQLAKLRMDFLGLHCYPEGNNWPEALVWIGELTLATCDWVLGPQDNRAALDAFLPPDSPMSCINRQVGHDPIERSFADLSVANFEMQSRRTAHLFDAHDQEIADALGAPLPAGATPSGRFEGASRIIVPTVRTDRGGRSAAPESCRASVARSQLAEAGSARYHPRRNTGPHAATRFQFPCPAGSHGLRTPLRPRENALRFGRSVHN